jgi:glutamate-1-semialdehyde 2,1-aminomutase
MATPGENLAAKIQHMSSASLEAAVFAAKQRYVKRNPNSKRLYNEACESLPGWEYTNATLQCTIPTLYKKGEAYQVLEEDDHMYVILSFKL